MQALLLVFLSLGVLLKAGTLAGEEKQGPAPNILLVTIDSLRPDHMGCYGYGKLTTPWIDRVAREGTLFRNAFSQGGWTSPAMVSVFTGLYPSVHGVEAREDHFPCPEQAPLAAWVQAGYQVPGHGGSDEENNYSRLGFQADSDYGFTPEQLFAWIRKHRSKPFLCWYHINKTPHLPYNPKESYKELFWPRNAPPPSASCRERLEVVQSKVIIPKGTLALTSRDSPYLLALYDGEVRMADDTVGSIYRFLDEEGLLDSTVVILTADQGEELMDHGFIGHASTSWEGTLFDEIIHVPLIIRYPPSIPAGRIVEEVVETMDILPTLQETAGIFPGTPMQGNSLLSLIAGNPDGWPGIAFSENTLCGYQCRQVPEKSRVRLVSVRTQDWKLIAQHTPGHTRFELYSIKTDPHERNDLMKTDPQIAGKLKDALLNRSYENRILRHEILQKCFSGQP